MLHLLHVYTSPNHGSSVLRYWPVTHVTHSHCWPWPIQSMTWPTDPSLLWFQGRVKNVKVPYELSDKLSNSCESNLMECVSKALAYRTHSNVRPNSTSSLLGRVLRTAFTITYRCYITFNCRSRPNEQVRPRPAVKRAN